MKTRINTIVDLVNDANLVMDIGCDHCYVAIELLRNNKCKHVINIDKNKLPLQQGINNLSKFKLLDKTTNLINDGLKGLSEKNFDKIDYIIIAGMGASTIISILNNNSLSFSNLILQTNTKPYKLREYIVKKLRITIISEIYIEENEHIYVVFLVRNIKNKDIYSNNELWFGKNNHIINRKVFYKFINNRLKYLEDKVSTDKVGKILKEEFHQIKQRVIDSNDDQGNL